MVDFDDLAKYWGKTVWVCDAETGKTGLPRDLAPCNCSGDRAVRNRGDDNDRQGFVSRMGDLSFETGTVFLGVSTSAISKAIKRANRD
ncbi:MAG: hypothetical protein ISS66_04775 [Desulfobacteraceae bacterium]|nr:hypothetical protein [Desulfobacteraceae bacterium]